MEFIGGIQIDGRALKPEDLQGRIDCVGVVIIPNKIINIITEHAPGGTRYKRVEYDNGPSVRPTVKHYVNEIEVSHDEWCSAMEKDPNFKKH